MGLDAGESTARFLEGCIKTRPVMEYRWHFDSKDMETSFLVCCSIFQRGVAAPRVSVRLLHFGDPKTSTRIDGRDERILLHSLPPRIAVLAVLVG
jgi:hypothetical protein